MPPEVQREILSDVILPDATESGADAIVILEAQAVYEVVESFGGSFSTKLEVDVNSSTELNWEAASCSSSTFSWPKPSSIGLERN